MRVRGCCPACDTHADRLLTWRVPWRRYRTSIHRGGFIPRAVLIWRRGVYDVVEHFLRANSVGLGSIAWVKQGVRLRGMATCYDHVCGRGATPSDRPVLAGRVLIVRGLVLGSPVSPVHDPRLYGHLLTTNFPSVPVR